MPMSEAERVASLLRRTDPWGDGCLVWSGPVDRWGYAHARWGGANHLAHRLIYTLTVGQPPEGYPALDHLCHTRAATACPSGIKCLHRRCLNVKHLEPVTHAENMARSERAQRPICSNGHEYTEATIYRGAGHRICRACNAAASRRYRERKAA